MESKDVIDKRIFISIRDGISENQSRTSKFVNTSTNTHPEILIHVVLFTFPVLMGDRFISYNMYGPTLCPYARRRRAARSPYAAATASQPLSRCFDFISNNFDNLVRVSSTQGIWKLHFYDFIKVFELLMKVLGMKLFLLHNFILNSQRFLVHLEFICYFIWHRTKIADYTYCANIQTVAEVQLLHECVKLKSI